MKLTLCEWFKPNVKQKAWINDLQKLLKNVSLYIIYCVNSTCAVIFFKCVSSQCLLTKCAVAT